MLIFFDNVNNFWIFFLQFWQLFTIFDNFNNWHFLNIIFLQFWQFTTMLEKFWWFWQFINLDNFSQMLTIFFDFDKLQESWTFWRCWQFSTILTNLAIWHILAIPTIFDNLDKFWHLWLFLQFWFSLQCWQSWQFWQYLTNVDNSDICFYHSDNWKDNPGDLWHFRHWITILTIENLNSWQALLPDN